MIRIHHHPDDNIALVVVSGIPTIDEFVDGTERLLADPAHTIGMDTIWDMREARLEAGTADQMRELARRLEAFRDRVARHVAFVVATDLDFGVCRMWEVYAEQTVTQHRRVFRDIDEAREWHLSRRLLGCAECRERDEATRR